MPRPKRRKTRRREPASIREGVASVGRSGSAVGGPAGSTTVPADPRTFYISFSGFVKVVSLDHIARSLGALHFTPADMVRFCRELRIPILWLNNIPSVDLVEFLIALKHRTRFGAEGDLAVGTPPTDPLYVPPLPRAGFDPDRFLPESRTLLVDFLNDAKKLSRLVTMVEASKDFDDVVTAIRNRQVFLASEQATIRTTDGGTSHG